jgi:NADH-quinone oxidoreductase subunit L
MPFTFMTYAVGMLALSGFPIFFSGFWSKDAILGAAHSWPVSRGPFVMLVVGALLTAFYMTRQISYVFFGHWRGPKQTHAHESPLVMTGPLAILAVFAIGIVSDEKQDSLESVSPTVWNWFANRLYFDELYSVTVIRLYAALAWFSDWLDRRVWGGAVSSVALTFRGLGWFNKGLDSQWIDGGFDKGCEELVTSGGVLAWLQAGRAPGYLRMMGIGVLVLAGIALLVGAVTGQVRL